jgi:hypothetical protein
MHGGEQATNEILVHDRSLAVAMTAKARGDRLFAFWGCLH